MKTKKWEYHNNLDALIASPKSHSVMFENTKVRVLKVEIPSKTKEPMHTHENPSIMIVNNSAKLKYHKANGTFIKLNRRKTGTLPFTEWLDPEGPHAVENIDDVEYEAIRIELKQ